MVVHNISGTTNNQDLKIMECHLKLYLYIIFFFFFAQNNFIYTTITVQVLPSERKHNKPGSTKSKDM